MLGEEGHRVVPPHTTINRYVTAVHRCICDLNRIIARNRCSSFQMLALFRAHEVFKHAVMSLLPSAVLSYSYIAVAYSGMVEMLPPQSLGITALIDMSRNESSHNFSARGTRTPRGTANDHFEHYVGNLNNVS